MYSIKFNDINNNNDTNLYKPYPFLIDFYLPFKRDNIRRKHNFLPLIIELLKQMAKEKQLTALLNKVPGLYLKY